MKIKGIATIAVLATSVLMSCESKEAEDTKTDEGVAKTEELTAFALASKLDSASYGIGVNIGTNMKNEGLVLNTEAIKQGMQDVFTESQTLMTEAEIGTLLNAFMAEKQEEKAAELSGEGAAFLAENKLREGVISTGTGLQYEIIEAGTGAIPLASDNVTTHYHGTLINGEVFDSSMDRGTPASFPVMGVIKGWQEALQLMPTGSTWRLYIPYDLAYGPQGNQGIGPYQTLIFDIQLISID